MTETKEYYRDKIAVVTGGAGGIGLALVELMLSYGAKGVVIGDVNEETLGREANRLNGEYPDRVLGVRCDVTSEADVQNLIQRAADFGHGRIDLLINNAGMGSWESFDKQTNADWERVFAVNFYSAVYGIRAVLPVMRAQGGGHIVSIISGIAFYPAALQSMYGATKAALNFLTLCLRYEYWDENIRFTSATPGTTATGIWEAGTAPPGSHSPREAAEPILDAVSRNERLALDVDDVEMAKTIFNVDNSDFWDQQLLSLARRRFKGEVTF